MIIDQLAQTQIRRIERFFPSLVYTLFLLSLVWVGFLSLEEKGSAFINVERTVEKAVAYDLSDVGKGALRLYAPSRSSLTLIAQQLLVISKNTRPDSGRQRAFILLGLQGSSLRKSVLDGNMLFLEEKDYKLHFATKKTDLWVTPQIGNEGEVRLSIGKRGEEGMTLIVRDEELLKDNFNPPFVRKLKEAVGYGPDHFMRLYGGKEYRHLGSKLRVKLGEMLYLGKGDYLTWSDGKWTPVSLKDAPSSQPLALVRSTSPKGMEIEVWDFTGFYSKKVNVACQTKSMRFRALKNNLREIRQRTASCISCLFGKQRLLLREGDWLLQSRSGWRHLRSAKEIQAYIDHELLGPLFVFDGVEKGCMHGHLFNEMRTTVEKISLPLSKKDGKK